MSGFVHRLPSELGEVEVWLPEGAELQRDPGVADGEQLWWSPDPERATLTLSHGPAAGRSREDLLGLPEAVDVEDGEHEVRLTVEHREARSLAHDERGHSVTLPERTTREQLRFRFWAGQDAVLRAGYRLDETAAPDVRDLLDRILDSVRLR